MANVGIGSGFLNPYLQADRMSQQAPAMQYDPNQYINPQMLAQQAFAQQQMFSQQNFNNMNPRMALPQNVGSAIGKALTNTLTPTQSGNPQQGTPNDPSQAVQQKLSELTQANLQTQQANGEGPNISKAQYMASAQLMTDPTYGSSQVAQQIAARYSVESKYTPEAEAKSEADQAYKASQTADTQTKQVDEALKVQEAKDKMRYVAVKYTAGEDKIPYPNMVAGTGVLPAFGSDGTLDPNIDQKKAALLAAAGPGATIMLESDYNANKMTLAAKAQDTALQRIALTQQARQNAMDSVNQDVVQKNGKALYNGDMLLSDLPKGNSPEAQGLYQGSLKAAYDYAESQGGTFSPTDAANRKKAESSWMSGTYGQQYMKLATAPRHLADLEDIYQGLQNGSFKPGNDLYQRWSRNMGYGAGTNVPSMDLAKSVFVQELSGALNARGGSDREKEYMESTINNSDAPPTLHNTLATEEKLWADKADDMRINYEQNVPGKKFLGNVVDPSQQKDYMRIYSQAYPVPVGKGDVEKAAFDKLPPDTTIKTPGGKVMKASDLRTLMGAQQ